MNSFLAIVDGRFVVSISLSGKFINSFFALKLKNLIKMSDDIRKLPTDKTELTNSEILIIDYLFPPIVESKKSNLKETVKTIALLAFLFIICNLPFIDTIINKIYPVSNNSFIITLVIKTILFVFLYFFITHFNLIQT